MYHDVVQPHRNFAANLKTNDMEDEDEITIFTFDLPMYMYPHQISGIRTGYYGLNKLLSGWQNDEYVIVGYINKEDANEFIGNNASAAYRFEHRTAVIAPNKDTTYSIVEPQMTMVLHECHSIFELRKEIRQLAREEDVKALFVDNITMLNCEGIKFESKDNMQYQISRSLCQLSRELHIPIISLVPITSNHDVPQRSDLKTSYERDADVVIFLTRDKDGKIDPFISKNRSGEISDEYCQN